MKIWHTDSAEKTQHFSVNDNTTINIIWPGRLISSHRVAWSTLLVQWTAECSSTLTDDIHCRYHQLTYWWHTQLCNMQHISTHLITIHFYTHSDLCKIMTITSMQWQNYNLQKQTRGSATAEEPRDALCQLKYYGRFLTELWTRSSANAQEPCEHTVSWNRVKCHTNVRWIAFENVCNRWMTFKVIQGHCRCYHLIGHILFHISLPL